MHVVFLITAQPNSACGVGDYTQKVVHALRSESTDCDIEMLPNWSLTSYLGIVKKYFGQKNTVLHLEYPSLGMGNSILPAFLPLTFGPRIFVTLHEFSVFNILRKMVFLPYSLFAKGIIMTNEYERKVFLKMFPWARYKTSIIPIGNNITVKDMPEAAKEEKIRLIYFGQISENKGIEFFVETVGVLRRKNMDIDCLIIGALINPDSPIADFVSNAAAEHNITLRFNLPSSDVSYELQRPTIALLAFPDGITDKRGSALACLGHGNAVITLHTEKTPEWWRKVTYHATSPDDAANTVMDLVNGQKELQPNIDILGNEMEARGWNKIALEHIALYKK